MLLDVKVTARWGYQDGTSGQAPEDIQRACLIQSIRLFKRKDAPFGVVGPNEFGQSTILVKFDPDVQMLLDPYRRSLESDDA